MMGKHGGEGEAAGHIASALGKQRFMNAGAPLTFSFFIQFRTPGYGVVPVTFGETTPAPSQKLRGLSYRWFQDCQPDTKYQPPTQDSPLLSVRAYASNGQTCVF